MGASGIDTHQGSKPQPPSVPCGFETSWDRTLSRSVGSKPRGSVGSTPIRDRNPRNWAPRHHNLWDRHPEGGTLDHWEFRDRNPWQPRSRVRTLRIETQESGSNPIGIETQESGSNPRDRNPRVGFEPHRDRNPAPIGTTTFDCGIEPWPPIRDRNPH